MSVAAHAAVERKKKLNREEEEMTGYRREELEQGWEFKIVRSASGVFKDPLALSRTVEEERLGSWDLLDKFDNERLRFRRPVAARERDGNLPLGYNPYRTQIGVSEGALVLFAMLIIASVVAAIAGLIVWATGGF